MKRDSSNTWPALEEALLFAMYLRNEKQTWIPRIGTISDGRYEGVEKGDTLGIYEGDTKYTGKDDIARATFIIRISSYNEENEMRFRLIHIPLILTLIFLFLYIGAALATDNAYADLSLVFFLLWAFFAFMVFAGLLIILLFRSIDSRD